MGYLALWAAVGSAAYAADSSLEGPAGAFRLGLEHGLFCLGCCWALMAVLVGSAAMGLAWAAVIALAVFAEKVLPGERSGAWRSRVRSSGWGSRHSYDEKEATMTQMQLKGTVLIACNCDHGCPCNFNALPTQGKCEGHWTWHVEHGKVDDVALDGLISLCVDWPGAIHQGGGTGVALVDERADEDQRQAVSHLISRELGGPWGILAWTWPTLEGPLAVPYELELDGLKSHVKAGDKLELELEPIRNPVTGAEVTPGVVLPQGLIVKQGDSGSSKIFAVRDGVAFEHPGKYTAIGPYDYSEP